MRQLCVSVERVREPLLQQAERQTGRKVVVVWVFGARRVNKSVTLVWQWDIR